MRDSDLNVVHIFHEMTNWLKFLSDCDNILFGTTMMGGGSPTEANRTSVYRNTYEGVRKYGQKRVISIFIGILTVVIYLWRL